MGHSQTEILELFQSEEYGGANLAARALEAEELQRIAAECAAVFGRARVKIIDAPEFVPPSAPGRLPMVR